MVKVSTKSGQVQLPSQLCIVEGTCRGLQVCLASPYGGLRLAPVKPVGLGSLSSMGMIVPSYRWYHG